VRRNARRNPAGRTHLLRGKLTNLIGDGGAGRTPRGGVGACRRPSLMGPGPRSPQRRSGRVGVRSTRGRRRIGSGLRGRGSHPRGGPRPRRRAHGGRARVHGRTASPVCLGLRQLNPAPGRLGRGRWSTGRWLRRRRPEGWGCRPGKQREPLIGGARTRDLPGPCAGWTRGRRGGRRAEAHPSTPSRSRCNSRRACHDQDPAPNGAHQPHTPRSSSRGPRRQSSPARGSRAIPGTARRRGFRRRPAVCTHCRAPTPR